MLRHQPDHAPAGECGLEILLCVIGEPGAARVPAAGESPALDLDEHSAFEQGKIRTPPAGLVEFVFRYDRRTAGGLPKKREVGFGLAHCPGYSISSRSSR